MQNATFNTKKEICRQALTAEESEVFSSTTAETAHFQGTLNVEVGGESRRQHTAASRELRPSFGEAVKNDPRAGRNEVMQPRELLASLSSVASLRMIAFCFDRMSGWQREGLAWVSCFLGENKLVLDGTTSHMIRQELDLTNFLTMKRGGPIQPASSYRHFHGGHRCSARNWAGQRDDKIPCIQVCRFQLFHAPSTTASPPYGQCIARGVLETRSQHLSRAAVAIWHCSGTVSGRGLAGLGSTLHISYRPIEVLVTELEQWLLRLADRSYCVRSEEDVPQDSNESDDSPRDSKYILVDCWE